MERANLRTACRRPRKQAALGRLQLYSARARAEPGRAFVTAHVGGSAVCDGQLDLRRAGANFVDNVDAPLRALCIVNTMNSVRTRPGASHQ